MVLPMEAPFTPRDGMSHFSQTKLTWVLRSLSGDRRQRRGLASYVQFELSYEYHAYAALWVVSSLSLDQKADIEHNLPSDGSSLTYC